MHGLINRAIQCFVTDMHGAAIWNDVARAAQLHGAGIEAMLDHDPLLTGRVLDATCQRLCRPRAEVLEDIGTYLVSHPNVEALRRLLRFGGEDFSDFLCSLDDLPERARLAVADLDLPVLELHELAHDRYRLRCLTGAPYRQDGGFSGFGSVMMGVLRAMADDYGALVVLDHGAPEPGCEVIEIALVACDYSEGRRFELGRKAG
ncbi:heme NO-binding domain-containing protein [Seohaeicola saemankumensis]|uniref:Heme NO-binding domain-containing protein n=1 Tax=Seohaeicola saemankumensis TaxID=481181 RepID=A0ABW3TAY4_9RHOB